MILNPEKDEDEEEEDEADDAPEEAEAVTTADTAPAAAGTDSTPPGTAPTPPGTAPAGPAPAAKAAPAAASGPNTTSITVLVNDPSKQGVEGTPVSVPAPAPAATPAPAAKPEKKDEPKKEDEPKAEKEEPKKLSGWEKARNLYSGAKGFYNSDEFSDGKEKFDGLGSSIWNKINSELKLGQAEADMMHLDDDHHL